MLSVVLVSTRNPLNIGAAARAMSNFGFLQLCVVNPYDVAWREARSAVGAAALLAEAKEYKSVSDAVADCSLVIGTTAATNRELQHPMRSLLTAARDIRKRIVKENVAILFGSEKRGLSNDDLSHCHWLLRIPTRLEHASMNLGQAVAVTLYELARTSTRASGETRPSAPSTADLERLTAQLQQLLDESGYIKPRAAASTEDKLRRMVRRLQLNSEDATTLLGMLRKIAWHTKNRK
jgi:TrmH family RNA methyltransferase